MFVLNEEEYQSLRFHFETSNKGRGGRRYLPSAFTELKVEEIKELISFEFDSLDKLIKEINTALKSIGDSNPDIIMITAVSAFASQFYTGVENVLKRLSTLNSIFY